MSKLKQLKFQDGYVVYSDGSTMPYWEKMRQSGETYYSQYTSDFSTLDEAKYRKVGNNLIRLANIERKKEKALIQKVTGNSDQYKDANGAQRFVKDFNELLLGKEQFKNLLDRIKAVNDFSKVQTAQNKSDMSMRAPTIASWFASYFGTQINHSLKKFATDKKQKKFWSNKHWAREWEKEIDKLIDEAIDNTVKQMFTQISNKDQKYGNKTHWQELYNIYNQTEHLKTSFKEMIKSKINIKQLLSVIQKDINTFKYLNDKNGARTTIDQALNLKSSRKSRGIGGSVEEYVISLIYTLLSQNSKGKYTISSGVFKNETQVIDNVTLFNFEKQLTINENELIKQFTTTVNSNNLLQTTKQMEDFYNNNLSQLTESFVVYTNTKSYSLGTSFRDFHGGTARSLEFAKQVLTSKEISATKAHNFVNAVYNTIPGAIFEDDTSLIENLKLQLSKAMARLLFDDWTTIGNQRTGARVIHVFSLDEFQVPLSVLLEATGKAILDSFQNSTRYFRINVSLPEKTLFSVPITQDQLDAADIVGDKMKDKMFGAWKKQQEIAKEKSTFSIRFLSNFKDIIKQFLE